MIDYINEIKKMNTNEVKYYILTMGCKLNENDSEKLAGMLEKMGYTETKEPNESNLIIINTCCVRENAEEKLFGKLGEYKKIKEKDGAIIAVCGCMMQEKHIVDKLKRSYRFIDIIFGTHTLHKLPEDMYSLFKNSKKIQDVLDIDGEIYEGLPIKRNDSKKASVTIMYGCNNFCAYCIVPYVRGRERSRQSKDIISEINSLAKEGYKEITLLGQNVNSYKGEGEIKNFADLLQEVNKIDGIEIIKFLSPHPKDFTDDVIKAVKECEKVSKLVHLPLQSGSTKVLEKMNRKYTKEQYLSLVEKMKKQIPNVQFSTDIIIGFPEETEEDFLDTLDVVKKVNFEQIFMFIYSRRVGTLADKNPNQIPEEIKHERFNRLKEFYDKQTEENNLKYINTIQKVLIEGISKNNQNALSGRTTSNKVVILEGSKDLIGKIIDVKIISEHRWYLKGEI
jgi:tRNA-2-methylthio-N6-dimethylallyladenosine synthase